MASAETKYIVQMGPYEDCDDEEWAPVAEFDSPEVAEAYIREQFEYEGTIVFRIDTFQCVKRGRVITSQSQG